MTDDRMKIESDYPPNYQAICDAFPWVPAKRGIIFAWDMTIFNPDDITITPSLMDHEQVHSIQQKGQPGAWWDKYLTDQRFRYQQEVVAHIAEYANIYRQTPDRRRRRLHLSDIAERLAGPLYGRLSTKDAAIRLLKLGAAEVLAPQPEEVAIHGN